MKLMTPIPDSGSLPSLSQKVSVKLMKQDNEERKTMSLAEILDITENFTHTRLGRRVGVLLICTTHALIVTRNVFVATAELGGCLLAPLVLQALSRGK